MTLHEITKGVKGATLNSSPSGMTMAGRVAEWKDERRKGRGVSHLDLSLSLSLVVQSFPVQVHHSHEFEYYIESEDGDR